MKNNNYVLVIFLGALLSILVTAYSAYAGLKIGGVYWPILATSVTSLALVKLIGKYDANVANIMQTAGNTGGMVAAGVIFTIPAAWMLGIPFTIFQITLIALTGSLLGMLFTLPIRKSLLHLPYPDGTAAAAVLQSPTEHTRKTRMLFGGLLLGGLISFLRDSSILLPQTLGTKQWYLPVSFIGIAGGFLIGTLYTSIWFLGATVSYVVLPTIDRLTLTNIGIGIIIGTAIAYIFTGVFPLLTSLFKKWQTQHVFQKRGFLGGVILSIVLISILTQAHIFITAFCVIGAFLMASVAGFVTGKLNIDPMEIFAIIVLLAVKFFFPADFSSLIILAAIITLSAGIAGDMMQDYKTGDLLHTSYKWQTIAQVVGGITASIVIGFIIFAIAQTSGFGNATFPAPQATAIAGIVKAQTISSAMWIGIAIGLTSSFVLNLRNLGLAPIVFGIGMYVPFSLSLSLFLGGLIRFWSDKKRLTETHRLAAAGLIAGESLIGIGLTLISFIKTVW